jgi:hypothetical protein
MNMKNHIQNTNTISTYAIFSSSIDLVIIFAQAPFISQGKGVFCSFCTLQGKKARDIIVQQDPRFNAMHSPPTPSHPSMNDIGKNDVRMHAS